MVSVESICATGQSKDSEYNERFVSLSIHPSYIHSQVMAIQYGSQCAYACGLRLMSQLIVSCAVWSVISCYCLNVGCKSMNAYIQCMLFISVYLQVRRRYSHMLCALTGFCSPRGSLERGELCKCQPCALSEKMK